MVGCRNTSMKPERATRSLCRKERFFIHGLMGGRDPNPGFCALREQRNSQPAEVSQISYKKILQQLTPRTQRLATSDRFQDTNTAFPSRVAWLSFDQIAGRSTKSSDVAWFFFGGRMVRGRGEHDLDYQRAVPARLKGDREKVRLCATHFAEAQSSRCKATAGCWSGDQSSQVEPE